jgi:hypothetical protein
MHISLKEHLQFDIFFEMNNTTREYIGASNWQHSRHRFRQRSVILSIVGSEYQPFVFSTDVALSHLEKVFRRRCERKFYVLLCKSPSETL